jgi:HD superfamily phosphodiesterase
VEEELVVSEKIAGIEIPDSRLAAEATALVREAEPPLLFDHSRRVYLFGMLHGLRRGLKSDPELLYVGAMFHDLGLTQTYRTTHQRFEIDGANEARRFLTDHGVGADDVRRVWTAIALHTTPGVPEFMERDRVGHRRCGD